MFGQVFIHQSCQKLKPDNLDLIFLFEGDRRLEHAMQSYFPPAHGEFWKNEVLQDMSFLTKLMTEEIPIPPRPWLAYTEHVESAIFAINNFLASASFYSTSATDVKLPSTDAFVVRSF